MSDADILRLATLSAAVLVVFGGVAVARAAATSTGRWWQVTGAYVIAAMIVYVAWIMGRSTIVYWGY